MVYGSLYRMRGMKYILPSYTNKKTSSDCRYYKVRRKRLKTRGKKNIFLLPFFILTLAGRFIISEICCGFIFSLSSPADPVTDIILPAVGEGAAWLSATQNSHNNLILDDTEYIVFSVIEN